MVFFLLWHFFNKSCFQPVDSTKPSTNCQISSPCMLAAIEQYSINAQRKHRNCMFYVIKLCISYFRSMIIQKLRISPPRLFCTVHNNFQIPFSSQISELSKLATINMFLANLKIKGNKYVPQSKFTYLTSELSKNYFFPTFCKKLCLFYLASSKKNCCQAQFQLAVPVKSNLNWVLHYIW